MINSYPEFITHLKDNEVFVYGANLAGFSGAGSAGYASFNESGNVWRKHNYDKWLHGTKGKWNYKGQIGFGEGTIGKSYAIPTVTKCGAKRSIPLEEIKKSVEKFYEFARSRPEWAFYVAQDAKTGLNGWSGIQMATVFAGDIPSNVYFYKPFAILIYDLDAISNK